MEINNTACENPPNKKQITINGETYGFGAWLYLDGRKVTFCGLDDDGIAWYIEGHPRGGWTSAENFSQQQVEPCHATAPQETAHKRHAPTSQHDALTH